MASVRSASRVAVGALSAIALLLSTVARPTTGSADPPAATKPADRETQLAERNRLWAEAHKLAAEGHRDKAIELVESVAAIERALSGEAGPDLAATYQYLAKLHLADEDFAAAHSALENALTTTTKEFGAQAWQTTDARLALAGVDVTAKMSAAERQQLSDAEKLNQRIVALYGEGNFSAAARLGEQALAISRNIFGEKHPSYAISLNNLAQLYRLMGGYARAEPLCRQALGIRKEALGEKHPGYATSLNNLALLYKSMGDYARAEPLFQQAMGIRKEALGERHPDYAQSLNSLAFLYESMGDYARAEPLCLQALEIGKEALGEKHPSYATSLNNLAFLYESMGGYARAEPLFRQALGIRKETLGEKHPDYAGSLNNLALLYKSMGDYARTEPLFRQALEIRKEVLGEKHPDYAASLNNLALLYESMGDYARAEPLFRQALEIRKEVLGEKHPDYAASLNNLALLYESMGDHARAEPLYRQALEIVKEVLRERHSYYASSLNNLALLYKSMGDYARAEPLYRQALEIRKEVLGEKHPDYATSLNNMAFLCRAMDKPEEAEPLVHQALEIQQTLLKQTAIVQSERQQRLMAAQVRSALDNYLSLVAESGQSIDGAYQGVLATKGAVLVRQRQSRLARSNHDPALLATLAELQSTATRQQKLVYALPGAPDREALKKQIDQLEQNREDLEANCRAKSPIRQTQAEQRMEPSQLRKALPAGSALVDTLVYSRSSKPPEQPAKILWEPRLAAFIITRDRPVVFRDLGPIAELGRQVDLWLGEGETPDDEHEPGTGAVAQNAGRELRRRFWEPLEEHLGGAKLILVSPDGPLCRFPLAALPGKADDTFLMEEGYDFVSLPAPQLLPEIVAVARRPLSAEGRLLLLGNVDFGVGDPLRSLLKEPAKSLPGTLTEIEDIARKYRGMTQKNGHAPKNGSAQTSQVCTLQDYLPPDNQRQATKARLSNEAPACRYLHLATHGFFAGADVKSAARQARDARFAFSPQSLGEVGGLAPELLSGLMLSGAHQAPDDGQEDGILTALEIAELDLHETDLAVLSACQTGLGDMAGGEGVLGLQRAFHMAGARTAVTSLWRVDDRITQEWMGEFYRQLWQEGASPLSAMRNAQLATLKDSSDVKPKAIPAAASKQRGDRGITGLGAGAGRRSPRYWAAFVLSGDWR